MIGKRARLWPSEEFGIDSFGFGRGTDWFIGLGDWVWIGANGQNYKPLLVHVWQGFPLGLRVCGAFIAYADIKADIHAIWLND